MASLKESLLRKIAGYVGVMKSVRLPKQALPSNQANKITGMTVKQNVDYSGPKKPNPYAS